MRYYYRLKPVGVDFTSERNVRELSFQLTSFADLNAPFEKLKTAFDTQSKERADIALNIFPDIHGITELCVFHNLKSKLFSKAVKKQCFLLCITKYESAERISDGKMDERTSVYDYETTDFAEVVAIFRDLIVNQVPLDLANWKCAYKAKQ